MKNASDIASDLLMNRLNLALNSTPAEEWLLFDGQCDDGRHTVLVYPYAFGQIRIRVTDKSKPDSGAPKGHGSIVRELDSYKEHVAADVIYGLLRHPDPPAYCESLAKPWNTAFDEDRIRLDNPKSEFRPS